MLTGTPGAWCRNFFTIVDAPRDRFFQGIGGCSLRFGSVGAESETFRQVAE